MTTRPAVPVPARPRIFAVLANFAAAVRSASAMFFTAAVRSAAAMFFAVAMLSAAAMYFSAAPAFSADADAPMEVADLTRAGSSDLPGESLYRLPVTLTTAAGTPMKLSALRHRPLIVTMFYSQCASVCPLLTAQLQRIVRRLSVRERRQVAVLMVSFDSTRDTPEALRAFAVEHHLARNWVVARASASDVRLLAAALGIQYRELADHTFNHSAVISVADREGVVRAQTSDLADSNGSFVTAVRRRLAP
ncbi:MAG TPA: SCO family protein [Steroidobacteraceae bacterium]|nr:SCO family protein [Steroidobacteraceae bacterium]